MGRNTAVKLKVTPLQFESRFVDQAEMSHVPVKLYIQKKEFNGKVVGGHTLNALITNPAYTPPAKEEQEGEGKRKHLLGKKSRDFLKGVAIGSQGAAIGASVIPGAQPLAPAFEAASLASGALAGMGKPAAKKKRYTLKAKKNSKSLLN